MGIPVLHAPLMDYNHQFECISLGNPHAVYQVHHAREAHSLQTIGPAFNSPTPHAAFPQGVNVGCMRIKDRQNLQLRVFERGVGETLACGSGACAAVIAGQTQGLLDPCVKVHFKHGALSVTWQGPGYPILLTGPTRSVFTGNFRI
jgi:diaminopimelate epimerase